MSLFHSSSQSKNRRNPDGSLGVYCIDCGRFISNTFERFSRAQCELCRRVQNGEPINDELVNTYRLSKQGKEDVSMLLVPPDAPVVEGSSVKKFSFSAMLGNFFEAMKPKQPVTAQPKSKRVAIEKKRRRLFESVQLGGEPVGGGMEDIDKQLRDAQEKG